MGGMESNYFAQHDNIWNGQGIMTHGNYHIDKMYLFFCFLINKLHSVCELNMHRYNIRFGDKCLSGMSAYMRSGDSYQAKCARICAYDANELNHLNFNFNNY